MDREIQLRIKTAVDNAQAAKSFQEIRRAQRELIELGVEFQETNSEAFEQVGLAAGELKDRVDDVKDSFATMTGDSLEQARTSIALLGEGLLTLDFDKARMGAERLTTVIRDFNPEALKKKVADMNKAFTDLGATFKDKFGGVLKTALNGAGEAFKGLGNIIKANPILLLAGVIILLVANFEKLSQAGGALGRVFNAIGQVIRSVTDLFTDLTDAIGLTDIAGQKQTEQFLEDSERQIVALKERYKLEQQIAEIRGKNFGKEASEIKQATEEYSKYSKARVELFEQLKRDGILLEQDRGKLLGSQPLDKAYEDRLKKVQNLNDENLGKFEDYRNKINAIENGLAVKGVENDQKRIDEKAKNNEALERLNAQRLFSGEKLANELLRIDNKYSDARRKKRLEDLEDEERDVKALRAVIARTATDPNVRLKFEGLANDNTETIKQAVEDYKSQQTEIAKAEDAVRAKQIAENDKKIDAERKKKAKDNVEKELKELENKNQLILNEEGVLTTERNKRLQENVEKRLAILANEKKRAALIAGGSTEGDVKVKESELRKELNDNKRNIEAIYQLENDARNKIAILKAKTLREETSAKIKQLTEQTDFELRDLNLTEERKIEIRTAAELKIAAFKKELQDQLDQNELDKLSGRAEAASATVDADPRLLNVLRSIELEAEYQEEFRRQEMERELAAAEKTEAEKEEIRKKYAEIQKAGEVKLQNDLFKAKAQAASDALALAAQYGQALSGLNELITQNENDQLRAGEKLTKETQKRQFVRTKALGIVNAAISTALAIMQAFAQLGPIAGTPVAIAMGVVGAVQIATIAAKKFNPDGGDTGSSAPAALGNLPGSAASSSSTPTPSAATMYNLGNGGTSNALGGVTQRVTVLESDITNTQRNVSVIEAGALLR